MVRVHGNRNANRMLTRKKRSAAKTVCHGPLQYTIYMLSYQSKSNELREARDVFFQWLSGHSQTGKCLVDRSLLGHLIYSFA